MKVTGLDKLKDKIASLGNVKGFRAAVLQTYGEAVERIFVEGKNANGEEIGQYSTEPIYVNPENSPRKFSPLGKNKKSTFKNGNKKKTRYFSDGYKGFRAKAGRQNAKVDLRLTGKLRADFQLDLKTYPYEAKFINDETAKIAEGNEERFGGTDIFKHTPQEIENLVRRTLEESKKHK